MDLVTIIERLVSERLGDGEGVIINLEFGPLPSSWIDNPKSNPVSSRVFSIMGEFITNIRHSLDETKIKTLQGQSQQGTPLHEDMFTYALAFTEDSFNGYRNCIQVDGPTSRFAVQYATSDIRLAAEFAKLFIDEILVDKLMNSSYGHCKIISHVPRKLEDFVINDFFDQQSPSICVWPSTESVISEFRQRGWNLYKVVTGKAVAKGPVDKIVFGPPYLVLPRINRSTDAKEDDDATINALASTGPYCTFTLDNGRQIPLRGFMVYRDKAVLTVEVGMINLSLKKFEVFLKGGGFSTYTTH